jgi:hypothetical protein
MSVILNPAETPADMRPESVQLDEAISAVLYGVVPAGAGGADGVTVTDALEYAAFLARWVQKHRADLDVVRARVEGGPDHPWIPGANFSDGALAGVLNLAG